MPTKVLVTGSKKDGFTWRLVAEEKTVKSGKEETEAQAVTAGQAAQIKYNRTNSWYKARAPS